MKLRDKTFPNDDGLNGQTTMEATYPTTLKKEAQDEAVWIIP